MIDQFRLYWTGRSERERRLLGIMFALLAAVVLWFGIIAPLDRARLEAQERLDQATMISGQVAATADAVRRAGRSAPPPLGASLAAAIAASSIQAGFTLSRVEPQGDDRIVFAISSAKSPALFAWLDGLARRGVFVEKIAIRPNSDATVSCDATLRLRRP